MTEPTPTSSILASSILPESAPVESAPVESAPVESALTLSRRALMKLGAIHITSFGEGTPEANIAAEIYPPTRDMLLSTHPWSFASKRRPIAGDQNWSSSNATNSFFLPSDFLRVISATALDVPTGRAPSLHYTINGDTLQTDSDRVFLHYIARVPASLWPSFFQNVMIDHLAAEFCLPLTENTSRTEFLSRRAERSLQRAKLIDSQQDSPRRIDDFSLIDVRD